MDLRNIRSNCAKTLESICASKLNTLFEIWSAVGHSNIEERTNIVCDNVKQLLDEMIEEETEDQSNLALQVEELLKEAAELCREVGADQSPIIAGLEDSNLPLLKVKDLLNERLKDCRACKQKRLLQYETLLKTESLLCKSMGLKKRPKISGVPKEEDLEEFAGYISMKQDEERELKQQYEETKEKIALVTFELGTSPDTTFHKMLVSDAPFCFSNENMLLLKELHQDMEQKLEKSKSMSIELREKLTNLWERLHVPYEEREKLLQKYPGYTKQSIAGLKTEIQRCEEEKRQNIRTFVEAIRAELLDWWEKCAFGEFQRQHFRAYYSDCFTEDLLELHEIEVDKLKRYYNENIDIIELVREREKLWKKMIELNERAHDPKRLFANRGGQLLKEEKERKAIQKDLPIIDKKLGCLLDTYENRCNTPFLYDGHDLRDLIKSKWDDFQKKKNDEKLARKKGKDLTFAEKASATKRKIPVNTPLSMPSKITKTCGATSVVHETAGCSTGSKVVRRLMDKLGSRENIGKVTTRSCVKSPEASYSDFENGLEKRTANDGMVRSSVMPPRVLRERNREHLVCTKERVATPVKPPRKNSVTRSCTNLSEFRTPQPSRKVTPGLSRTRSAPRLAAPRGHLPIII